MTAPPGRVTNRPLDQAISNNLPRHRYPQPSTPARSLDRAGVFSCYYVRGNSNHFDQPAIGLGINWSRPAAHALSGGWNSTSSTCYTCLQRRSAGRDQFMPAATAKSRLSILADSAFAEPARNWYSHKYFQRLARQGAFFHLRRVALCRIATPA